MKRCTGCEKLKPLSEFYKRSNRPGGYHPECRKCSVKRVSARYRKLHPVVDPEVLPPGTKRCSTCDRVKLIEDYHKNKSSPDGKSARCKVCVKNYQQEHYTKLDAERPEQPDDKYCKACDRYLPRSEFYNARTAKDGKQPRCKECQRRATQERARANPEHVSRLKRNTRLKALYKITSAQFDELLSAQGGRCYTCGTSNPGTKGWAVDHDHSCCPGKSTCGNCLRKILCSKCNGALGLLNDDINVILALAEYMREHPPINATMPVDAA